MALALQCGEVMAASGGQRVFVPLTEAEWEAPHAAVGGKGWWSCNFLGLPGARLEGLWARGKERIPKDLYRVRGRRVHWKAGLEPPRGIEAEIALRRPLAGRREVFLALLLGLLLGAYAAARHPAELARLESVLIAEGAAALERTTALARR